MDTEQKVHDSLWTQCATPLGMPWTWCTTVRRSAQVAVMVSCASGSEYGLRVRASAEVWTGRRQAGRQMTAAVSMMPGHPLASRSSHHLCLWPCILSEVATRWLPTEGCSPCPCCPCP